MNWFLFTVSLLKVNVFFSLILDVISPKDETFVWKMKSQSNTEDEKCHLILVVFLEYLDCFGVIYSSSPPPQTAWAHFSEALRHDETWGLNRTKGECNTSIEKAFVTRFQDRLLFYCFRAVTLPSCSCSVGGGEPNIQEYIWVEMQENITINKRKRIPGTLKGVWWEHAASRSAP